MSTQHTPGPWVMFANSLGVGVTAKGSADVARCNGFYEPNRKRDEEIANARLIAAAPDLLEALQYVMSAHGEQLTDAFEQAQRAIAKATGQ